jgi:hypothetical protein
MLSISTQIGHSGEEIITPRAIARGRGDHYLLVLNRMFGQWRKPAYVRVMAEPNGYWNAYSAYDSDGAARGGSHKKYWYKLAWRRIAIVVRDGGPLWKVNRRLRARGLRPLNPGDGNEAPDPLWKPQVALLWTPQTFGSPDVPGNMPGAYWPGGRWVDWVGTDFYSKFAEWGALNRFYRRFGRRPFAFGEWGVWGRDRPSFVRRFFKWQRRHRRVRLMVYYNGLYSDPRSPFNIAGRPMSRKVLRKQLRRPRYPALAPEWRFPEEPSGGLDPGST